MNDENEIKIDKCQSKLFDEHLLNAIENECIILDEGKLSCDEFHAHSFDCIFFKTNEARIIKALIENVRLANRTIATGIKVLQVKN